jgi:uncharacterized membrane protein YkvA (DUF1232 family)
MFEYFMVVASEEATGLPPIGYIDGALVIVTALAAYIGYRELRFSQRESHRHEEEETEKIAEVAIAVVKAAGLKAAEKKEVVEAIQNIVQKGKDSHEEQDRASTR